MQYAFHFGPDGIQPVEGLGEPKQPVIVGDLLAVWAFEDPRHPRYLIDGLEGEVKSGENVKSPSLNYYRRKYADCTPLAVRLSLRNLSYGDGMLSLPLYLADHAVRLLEGMQ